MNQDKRNKFIRSVVGERHWDKSKWSEYSKYSSLDDELEYRHNGWICAVCLYDSEFIVSYDSDKPIMVTKKISMSDPDCVEKVRSAINMAFDIAKARRDRYYKDLGYTNL